MRYWFLFITITLLLSGCNFNTNNNRAAENNEQNLVRVKNSNIPEVDRQTGQDIAEYLVDLTTGLPNIEDATAVVLGRFAFVGIDVKEDLDRSEVGSIKYSVAEALRNDPHGARAIVIADPDITARLREIREDIENGQPIQGIINELADISGRLMPEIPADIVNDKNAEKSIEEPKNKLNSNEENNLENKQQKQSNHHYKN